jgi:hypothetical protein
MKSLRGLTCFVVVILLLGFIVGHGLAALPDSREIKDQFMWGDPDWVESIRASDYPNRIAVCEQAWDAGSGPVDCVIITFRVVLSQDSPTCGRCRAVARHMPTLRHGQKHRRER